MEKFDRGIRSAYAWACERLYHEFAWSYDGVSRLVSAGQWQAWRAVAVPLVQGEDVLELGFGTGVLMQELTEQGLAVTGVDASTSMVRIAQRRLERRKLDAAITQATGQALPFADQSFDTVVCNLSGAVHPRAGYLGRVCPGSAQRTSVAPDHCRPLGRIAGSAGPPAAAHLLRRAAGRFPAKCGR